MYNCRQTSILYNKLTAQHCHNELVAQQKLSLNSRKKQRVDGYDTSVPSVPSDNEWTRKTVGCIQSGMQRSWLHQSFLLWLLKTVHKKKYVWKNNYANLVSSYYTSTNKIRKHICTSIVVNCCQLFSKLAITQNHLKSSLVKDILEKHNDHGFITTEIMMRNSA